MKFVPRSLNGKIGIRRNGAGTPNPKGRSSNVATVYRPVGGSCPQECPFLTAGCYAKLGNCGFSEKVSGLETVGFLEQASTLPAGHFVRLQTSGDFFRDDRPDVGYVEQVKALASRRPDLKIWSYTHGWARLRPGFAGIPVSASCSTESEVRAARSAGWPTVITVSSKEKRASWKGEGGESYTLCPAQRIDSVTCESCQLCMLPNRQTTIAFQSHGDQTRKVDSMLARLRSLEASGGFEV